MLRRIKNLLKNSPLVTLFTNPEYDRSYPKPSVKSSPLKPSVKPPHKNIQVTFRDCYHSSGNIVFEFAIMNRKDDIDFFGLRIVNIYDSDGNSHTGEIQFGELDRFQNITWNTLPKGIPITTRIILPDPTEKTEYIVRVKIGCYMKWKKQSVTHYKLGEIIFHNIPITSHDK